MAQFLGIHKLPHGMSEQELKEGYNSYKDAAIKSGLKPLGAIYSIHEGFAYCQTEAPRAEDVRLAHQNVKIPLEDVVEIKTIE